MKIWLEGVPSDQGDAHGFSEYTLAIEDLPTEGLELTTRDGRSVALEGTVNLRLVLFPQAMMALEAAIADPNEPKPVAVDDEGTWNEAGQHHM